MVVLPEIPSMKQYLSAETVEATQSGAEGAPIFFLFARNELRLGACVAVTYCSLTDGLTPYLGL